MKKLFALMLALCLSLTAFAAMAETATAEITWEEVAPMVENSGITGEFVTFDEIAVKLFVPEGMTAAELTDEDREKGYIGYYAAEDGDAIAIQYVNVEGMALEDYAASIQGDDVTGLEFGTVNGLPCISYEYNSCLVCAFTTQMGYILEVTVGPAADDNAKMGASIVLASIQAAE